MEADFLRTPSLLKHFFESTDNRRVYVSALAVAVAYYAGVKIGLALTFDPYPVSILWPPNAILLASLLITPARTWYVILLAAFPAHVLAELEGGIPLLMVLCWFLSNVSEALIAAVSLRWLLGRSPVFHRVDDVGAFLLCAACLAPFVSSFIDAAFVRLVSWGKVGYWEVWRTRFASNMLAALTIVPFIVAWANAGWHSLREMASHHLTEGALLLCGLFAVGLLVFAAPADDVAKMWPALLYLPVPFLLWAAVRFGPIGSATAFLTITLVVIWGAGQGRGPFLGGSVAQSALSIQLFIAFVGITLLILSASVQEYRDSERHLQQNDERFGLVLRATNEVIFDWDIVADRLWWNENGEIFFGRMSDDRRADCEAWCALVHPEDKERIMLPCQAVRDSGKQTLQAEYRLRDRGGKYVYVNARGFIVRDEAGKPVRMIGSLRDITDRKRMEESKQQLARVSRLAVIGELAASIAHEISQPLTAIRSNVYAAEILLGREVIEVEELKRIIDDIRYDSMRTSDVIKHVRSLFANRRHAIQPFDMNHTVREALHLLQADLARHGVTAETQLASLPRTHGDPVQLLEVLLNLILNAVDAMCDTPKSSRRLRILTRCTDTGGIVVTVLDSGPGIAPEHARHLFQSFFTTKPNGMGLGLSITRSIIEAHGGTIQGTTRREGGANFTFFLPPHPRAEVDRSDHIHDFHGNTGS